MKTKLTRAQLLSNLCAIVTDPILMATFSSAQKDGIPASGMVIQIEPFDGGAPVPANLLPGPDGTVRLSLNGQCRAISSASLATGVSVPVKPDEYDPD